MQKAKYKVLSKAFLRIAVIIGLKAFCTSDFSIHSCVYLNSVFINLTECTQKNKLYLHIAALVERFHEQLPSYKKSIITKRLPAKILLIFF